MANISGDITMSDDLFLDGEEVVNDVMEDLLERVFAALGLPAEGK